MQLAVHYFYYLFEIIHSNLLLDKWVKKVSGDEFQSSRAERLCQWPKAMRVIRRCALKACRWRMREQRHSAPSTVRETHVKAMRRPQLPHLATARSQRADTSAGEDAAVGGRLDGAAALEDVPGISQEVKHSYCRGSSSRCLRRGILNTNIHGSITPNSFRKMEATETPTNC